MNVLLIGSAGFIGGNLQSRLEKQHIITYCLDIKQKTEPRNDFLICDKIENLFNYQFPKLDVIVCCSGSTIPATSNDDVKYDVQANLLSMITVFDYAKEFGVPKVVFLSSGGAVYGNPLYLPIDENHPTSPITSYATTKLAIESYAKLYSTLYGIQVVSLRLANVYGKNQKSQQQGIIPIFISKMKLGEEIIVYGDGSNIRDYVHVDDVCSAIVKAMSAKLSKFEIINVGTGTGTSTLDVIQTISRIVGACPKIKFMPARLADLHINILDVKYAMKVLDWRPMTPLVEGIQRCV